MNVVFYNDFDTRTKLYSHTAVFLLHSYCWPVPVAARSKAYVFGRSPAEIVGSNPTGGMDVYLLCALCVVKKQWVRKPK